MASSPQEGICSECDVDATWYCVQEDVSYCDEHNVMAHTLKAQKSHRIVPIAEKYPTNDHHSDEPPKCKNHHMPLCLYCSVCKDVCCVACLSVDIHREHSDQVKSVVDVANAERETLSKNLERVQRLKIAFNDEQKQLEQALRNVEISEDEGMRKINHEFERLIKSAETRQKWLQKQLIQKSQNYRENIQARQVDLDRLNVALQRCLDEGQHVLSLNDFMTMAQSKKVVDQIQVLEREDVESYNQTRITNSLQPHLCVHSIVDTINLSGFIGLPPTSSFIQENCTSGVHHLDVEWQFVENDPPVTEYVLEVGRNDNDFTTVYAGLETSFRLSDLQPNTLYSLRLHTFVRNETHRPTLLEMKTRSIDMNDWTLSMSSTYASLRTENTREALLDGQFNTGAATDAGTSWIKATFPSPILVNSVTIAPLYKNSDVWGPMHGNSGTLQYSHDQIDWTTVGTIAYKEMRQQRIPVGGITARYWRLSHSNYLGASSFVFE